MNAEKVGDPPKKKQIMDASKDSDPPKKSVLMAWSEEKDLEMLKEVAAEGVFNNKCGSRERGTAWQNVSKQRNALPQFNVSARSIRDRFNVISKKLKAKLAKELKESGGGDEDQSEIEILLEELMEMNDDCEKRYEEQSGARKIAMEVEKRDALEMRNKAMERMGETRKRCEEEEDEGTKKEKKRRRSGGETFEWLKEKTILDKEFKEQEMKERKEEREAERAEHQLNVMRFEAAQQLQNQQFKLLQQEILQQTQLQQQQQQQQQQQFMMLQQQMMQMMQNQQQQTNAMLASVKKNDQ